MKMYRCRKCHAIVRDEEQPWECPRCRAIFYDVAAGGSLFTYSAMEEILPAPAAECGNAGSREVYWTSHAV